MNKYIYVMLSKARVFTDIISFALHSSKKRPKQMFGPNLITGQTKGQRR